MTGHTPGKWKYSGSYEERKHVGFGWFVDLPGEFPRIIRVEGGSDKEASANARLVAAAPDLLEALRVADAHIGWGDAGRVHPHKIIRDAITKAIGD